MLNNLNSEEYKLIKQIENERNLLNHHYVGTEHLLLALLKLPEIKNICNKINLNYNIFQKKLIRIVGIGTKKITDNFYTPLLNSIIKKCLQESNQLKPNNLLNILATNNVGIAGTILKELQIDLSAIKEHSIDGLTIINPISINHIYYREEEIEHIMTVLLQKNKCNPLLVGEPGVGKTAIIEELAYRFYKHLCPSVLFNKKIGILDLSKVLAGTKYRGEFEEKLNKIIEKVMNDSNLIIFIDEIHVIMNAGGAEGAIGSSDILKPYLARSDIKCIGATTYEEYESLKKDKALARRFQTIHINEPSKKDTYNILMKLKKNYENYYDLKIPNNILKKIVFFSKKYLVNNYNPDSSITILDSLCSFAKLKERKIDDLILDSIMNQLINVKSYNEPKKINNIIYNTQKELNDYLKNIDDSIVVDLNGIDITNILVNNSYNVFKKLISCPDKKIVIVNYNKCSLNIKNVINSIFNKKILILNDGTKINFSFAHLFIVNKEGKNQLGFINKNNSDWTNNIVNIPISSRNNIALKP